MTNFSFAPQPYQPRETQKSALPIAFDPRSLPLCAAIINVVCFQIMSLWMSIIVISDSRVWNQAQGAPAPRC